MNREHERLNTPEENYEAASLELALYRIMKRDQDAVKAAMSVDEENELSRMTEEKMPHMLSFIDTQMKHMAARSSLLKHGRRFLQIAAVVVLILNIGLTAAVAASSSVRATVIRFLMEMNDSYMSIGFIENEGELIVPEEWEGNYYPTYIPQGYFIQRCTSVAGANAAEYSNAEGNTIVIEVNGVHAFGRINTENAEIEFIQVHGVEATVLRQPVGDVSIIWSLGDCYFEVTGNDYETALAVAQSIEVIQKRTE